jgi:hypothetical protein
MNASLDSLRAELRELPAPEPSADLLPRILASRARGLRVPLPTGRRRAHVALLVAAALTVALGTAHWAGLGRAPSHEAAPDLYGDLLGGMPWLPTPGAAQERPVVTRAPRYPIITEYDPGRVAGGIWTYEQRTTTDEVLTRRTAGKTVALSRWDLEGGAAWFVTTWRDTLLDAADSAFYSNATLRPVRFALTGGHKGRTRIVQQYSSDSMRETIDITGPRERHFHGAIALPGPQTAPLLMFAEQGGLVPLVQALPLKRGWRGSVYAVGLVLHASPGSPLPPFLPLDLRVTGRDRVTVPAGTFDCWRLAVAQRLPSGEYRSTVWVSLDRQWVVKTEERGGDFVSEQLLVSYTATAP